MITILQRLSKLHVLILFIIVVIIVSRLYLGIVRYFDPDEFAHMHWTFLIVTGYLPYKDFFIYHIPFFQWILLPIFSLPPSPTVLLITRIFMCGIIIGVMFLTYKVSQRFTKLKSTALLACLIFLVFPMTFDKSIEVRPDLLMTAFYMIGIYLLLCPFKTIKHWLLIGLCLALSLLVFPKIIFAFPAAFFLTLPYHRIKTDLVPHLLVPFLIGFSIPFIVFIAYVFITGTIQIAFESIFIASRVVNTAKASFSLFLALSPFPLVYIDRGGLSFPWMVNTTLWISGFLGLLVVFRQKITSGLFFSLFFTGAIIFLYLFPLPYLQYFIPLSPFVSILSAICIEWISTRMKSANVFDVRRYSLPQFFTLCLVIVSLLLSYWQQYALRLDPRASNTEQLQVIRDMLKISKPTDTAYDMVGSYVFRPDGYYICCHPYQEFVDRLPWKVPSLKDSLIAQKTKFIVLDRSGQSLWLPKPDDLSYILSQYVASPYPKIYTLK